MIIKGGHSQYEEKLLEIIQKSGDKSQRQQAIESLALANSRKLFTLYSKLNEEPQTDDSYFLKKDFALLKDK